MRIANYRFPTIITVALMAFFLTACVPNYVPFYVAGKIETLTAVRKQQEMAHYLDQFKNRRSEFETQLDAFYVNSLRQAEEDGVLNAEGIAYLNKVESDKRSAFNANEAVALARLESNLKFYDDIIELQGMTTASIRETERQNAQAFRELVVELREYAIQEAKAASERRLEWLGKQAEKPVNPSEESVWIIQH